MTDAAVPRDVPMTGMRLALFTETYPPQMNGVSRTLERLVREVDARGGAVRVFTADDPAAHAVDHVERWASVPFWAYPQLRLAAPRVRAAAAALRAWRPTLVHVATEFGVGLGGRGAARRLGLPLVSSYHTNFLAYAQFYRLGVFADVGWNYFRWFHGAALRTFVPTDAIRTELEGRGFERLAVWGRGVEASRFDPRFRSEAWRAAHGIAPDDTCVLYVGRIAKEKGLAHALDAMHRLHGDAAAARLRFVFVGDGPYDAELRAQAPAGTIFTGRLEGEALSTAYASGDVFLFPSVTDTFGNVLLEAMASGLLVVAADAGNTREIAGDGRGTIVRADDGAAIAEALRGIAADPAGMRRTAAIARAWALERTWPRIWDGLFAEYRRLAGLGHG
ncbi:MAG: glycosyltransferase family 1 protein [Gemmatimonadaceae bacterium]|jgi:glycosyltransferase involved in cell wall biosynthesis|nr:glycosyltransferase family 1 protein [Gemmatimonadaceae bacterium]